MSLLIKRLLSSPTVSSFSVNNSDMSATLTYQRYGKTYKLYLPYSKTIISKMIGTKVYLIKGDSEEMTEITQQPGIPYLVTARMLGGDKIRCIKGERVKEFEGDEIPVFDE